MNQELLMKAQFLQKQIEELEQHLQLIDREIEDLNGYDASLSFFQKSKEKSIIASIGKGIHVKANIESKDLLVEVGSGVVVKKTPEEARDIISLQIKKLADARLHVIGKLDIYQKTIESVVLEIEQSQKAEQNNKADLEKSKDNKKKHEHKH